MPSTRTISSRLAFAAFRPWRRARLLSRSSSSIRAAPPAGESAEAEIAARLRGLGCRIAHVPEPKIFHVRDTSLGETTALNFKRGQHRAALARTADPWRQAPFLGVMLETLAIPGSLQATPVAPFLRIPNLAYLAMLGGLGLQAA